MSLRNHLLTEHAIDGTAEVIQTGTEAEREALHDEDHDRIDAGEDLRFVSDHPRESRQFVPALAERALRKARA